MLQELSHITGSSESDIKERWLYVEQQVLKYTPKDGRKAVKSLLSEYNQIGE